MVSLVTHCNCALVVCGLVANDLNPYKPSIDPIRTPPLGITRVKKSRREVPQNR